MSIGNVKLIKVRNINELWGDLMEYTLFIDESGNTGLNWLNKDQPFFIYGGWLIPNENIDKVNSCLNQFIKKEQSGELKSKNIFDRTNGDEIFIKIFKLMINEFSALPIFSIVEKEFMVAAKIVEIFFDCENNPNLNDYLTHPVKLKKALANSIYSSKETLELFSKIMTTKDMINFDGVGEIKNVSLQLVRLFEKNNHFDVADSLKNLSDENLVDIVDEIFSKKGERNRKTLAPTILVDILRRIELLSNKLGSQQVNVILDRLRGYSNIFDEIEDMFCNKSQPYVYRNEENRIWLSNFPSIRSIEGKDSKSVPCIQAADLLCGFMFKVIPKTITLKPLNKMEKSILKEIDSIESKVLKDTCIWDYFTTYSTERKLITNIKGKLMKDIIDFDEIIREEFVKAIEPCRRGDFYQMQAAAVASIKDK